MPYIFPKRKLRTQDILDPIELNEDFVPVAEVYSGKLNAHNINTDTKEKALLYRNGVDETAYYKYAYTSYKVGPGLGDETFHSYPTAIPNAYRIPNAFEWDTVESSNLSITTGSSTLWIVAHVQYFWKGFLASFTPGGHKYSGVAVAAGSYPAFTPPSSSGPASDTDARPCRVQFAIRVDGNVLLDTITGSLDPFERSYWAMKPTQTFSAGSAGRDSEQPSGLGPEVLPVRLGCAIKVEPGTHSVEIVARRIPSYDTQLHEEDDIVRVTTRKVFALELNTFPQTSSVGNPLDIPAFEGEETLSESSLQTNRLEAAKDALEEIEEGNLSRGALANYHLPSAVVQTSFKAIHDGTSSFKAKYPGFTSETVASSSSGTGWWPIRDGGGNLLQTDNSSNFSYSENSVFLVMANVHVVSLTPDNTGTSEGDTKPGQFACFRLGWKNASGSSTLPNASEVCVNHFAAGTRQMVNYTKDKALNERVDIALFTVVKSSNLTEDIQYFAVYGSTTEDPYTASDRNECTTWHGSISVIQLKV